MIKLNIVRLQGVLKIKIKLKYQSDSSNLSIEIIKKKSPLKFEKLLLLHTNYLQIILKLYFYIF